MRKLLRERLSCLRDPAERREPQRVEERPLQEDLRNRPSLKNLEERDPQWKKFARATREALKTEQVKRLQTPEQKTTEVNLQDFLPEIGVGAIAQQEILAPGKKALEQKTLGELEKMAKTPQPRETTLRLTGDRGLVNQLTKGAALVSRTAGQLGGAAKTQGTKLTTSLRRMARALRKKADHALENYRGQDPYPLDDPAF